MSRSTPDTTKVGKIMAITRFARLVVTSLAGGGVLTAATLGLVTTASAGSPVEQGTRIVLAADTASMGAMHSAGFCLFGHNPNGSCRGAKRASDAWDGTVQMYEDAGECAAKGVGEGLMEGVQNPEAFPETVVVGSVVGGTICGSD